jgi:hypothetical protein
MGTGNRHKGGSARVGIEWRTRALFLVLAIALLAAADWIVDAKTLSVWLRAAVGFPLLTVALGCFAVVVGVTHRQVPAFRRILVGMVILAALLVLLVLLAGRGGGAVAGKAAQDEGREPTGRQFHLHL